MVHPREDIYEQVYQELYDVAEQLIKPYFWPAVLCYVP